MRPNSTLKVAGWSLLLASAAGLLLLQNEPARAASAPHEPGALQGARLQPYAAGLPLRFEINRGQLADDVEFLARGHGYGLYLTESSATLLLLRGSGMPASVSLRLVGARAVEPRGVDELPGRNNYFIGADRSKWKTEVESYARVRYDEVLPGVSMVYYGTDGKELEYDLEVAPGASPRSIELAFEGAETLELDSSGAAVLHLVGGGELRQPAPVSYQLSPSGQRLAVESHYERRGPAALGLTVGQYDVSRPLIIDPKVVYATFVGGDGFEDTYGTAVDTVGNVYVVGQTTSTIFSTFMPFQVHVSGISDCFISKINVAGTAFVYSTYLGGTGSEFAYGVVADAAGNAYVGGLTTSSNFPTAAPLQASYGGGSQDGFITKLTPSGNALTYSTYFGGSGDDYVAGIALDVSNNAMLVGSSSSTNLPLMGAFQGTLGGVNDAFVAKLNALGGGLLYSSYLGGAANEAGSSIRVSSSGEAFVTGSTFSLNFPVMAALQPARAGGFDAFVARVNASGSGLVYSTYLGGSGTDHGASLSLDTSGNAYVAGDTNSNNFPTAAAYQAALAGSTDAFLTKLTSDGSAFVFSTYLGGSGADIGLGVALDPGRSVYVVGSAASTNFPVIFPTQAVNNGGPSDGFVTKLKPSGAALSFSTYLGGSSADRATAVTADSEANVFVVGNTQSSNFPLYAPFRPNFSGSQDGFVTKITFTQAAPASGLRSGLLFSGMIVGLGLMLLSSRHRRESC